MRSNWTRKIASVVLTFAFAGAAQAQFDSGSTGLDGALNIVSNTVLPVQADGVHNYTTINVAPGVTLSFTPNATNTPVVLLASGDVTISGTISLNGGGGRNYDDALAGQPGSEALPGPGGFRGGVGAIAVINGGTGIASSGGGPGGGAAANDASPSGSNGRAGNGGSHFTPGGVGNGNPNGASPVYGDPRLLALSGGSGGAGANVHFTSATSFDGAGGGAGGGAILIASSGALILDGSITANGGGAHGGFGASGGGSHGSGGGAGGMIRLMANAISGSGSLSAVGGGGGSAGGNGRIKLEAFSFGGAVAANTTPPAASSAPTIIGLDPGDVPTIQITSIAGQAVTQPPSGSTTTPDVTIPAATANPVTIALTTTNIPNGAVIKLRIVLQNGNIVEATSTPVASNAATASVSLAATVGVIYATADFTP